MEFLTTFGMALMPVAVMKDSIAAGMALNMPIAACYAAAVLGSICPIPFLLILIGDRADRKRPEGSDGSVADKPNRAASNGSIMGRYGEAIIFLFAAMPFLAGATWIGAVLSAFLHINIKKALLLLFLGSLISGGIALIMLR